MLQFKFDFGWKILLNQCTLSPSQTESQVNAILKMLTCVDLRWVVKR